MSKNFITKYEPTSSFARKRRRADPSLTLGQKLVATEARAELPTPELERPDLLDRAQGVMLGFAVGDALGSTLEFQPRIERIADYHREMRGGGPFNLPVGAFTDDTAMGFALAKSLILRKGFDPYDVMTRFVSWYRTGEYSCTGSCFDIGVTTRKALERFERNGDPFAGSTDERESGNGSLMRLAPVALFTLDNEVEAIRIAQEQSRLTHAAPQCVDACDYFVRLLRSTLLGGGHPLELGRWSGHSDIERAKTAYWGGRERRSLRSSGYVADTLECALASVAGTATFEDALVAAANLGGDADTVGTITGALAGAKYGASSIPKRWLEPLRGATNSALSPWISFGPGARSTGRICDSYSFPPRSVCLFRLRNRPSQGLVIGTPRDSPVSTQARRLRLVAMCSRADLGRCYLADTSRLYRQRCNARRLSRAHLLGRAKRGALRDGNPSLPVRAPLAFQIMPPSLLESFRNSLPVATHPAGYMLTVRCFTPIPYLQHNWSYIEYLM